MAESDCCSCSACSSRMLVPSLASTSIVLSSTTSTSSAGAATLEMLPATFSFVMRSVARALVSNPVVIMADEPTGNLDSKTTDQILDLFDELHDDGKTIVMVTHDDEVAERCQRVVRLRDGLIETDVRNPERVRPQRGSPQDSARSQEP